MIRGLIRSATVLAGFLGMTQMAAAQSIFFHTEGEPGSRKVYFSSTITMDRTAPADALGPIAVTQLDVVIIAENAAEPEWSTLRLLFECPSMIAQVGKSAKKTPTQTDTVRVRIGPGGFVLRRSDLKLQELPAGQWFETRDRSMQTARRLACNSTEISKAIRTSYRDGRFDMDGFNRLVKAQGFADYLGVIPVTTAAELHELTWNEFWKGSVHPDPSGRWSQTATDADRAAAAAKMDEVVRQVDRIAADIQPRYEADLKRMQGKFDFDERAGRLRAGRKLNRAESSLIMAWQGKTEPEVFAVLGPAYVSNVGDLKILSYGKQFDNRSIVQDMRSGAAWEEGIYMHCNVDYVLMPDAANILRIADVRVSVDSNTTASSTAACSGLMQAPGG